MTTAVTVDQLRNLTNRAGTGLTPDEQQRLRDGIDHLARAETALAEARRLHAQTCPHAQGHLPPPAFTCSLCDALTEPTRETT